MPRAYLTTALKKGTIAYCAVIAVGWALVFALFATAVVEPVRARMQGWKKKEAEGRLLQSIPGRAPADERVVRARACKAHFEAVSPSSSLYVLVTEIAPFATGDQRTPLRP